MATQTYDITIDDESFLAFRKWGYDFEGAFTCPEYLKTQAGVYVIWCRSGVLWTILDAGESENVRQSVLNHERKTLWSKMCLNSARKLYFSATYTTFADKSQRIEIVNKIKNKNAPIFL